MKEGLNAYRFSLENPNGKRLFGRPRLRGDDNITMDLKDISRKVCLTMDSCKYDNEIWFHNIRKFNKQLSF
jgi:hypothetical protein